MHTISEIHSLINSEYKKLQNDYEQQKELSKQTLYAHFPRIEEIDNEISMLAITSAKKVLEEKITPEEATSLMKQRADKLKKERMSILQNNDYSEYTPKYKCDLCSDTGYTQDGSKCRCYMQRLRSLIVLPGENANTESEFFKNAVFENFNLSYYPDEIDTSCGYIPRQMMKMNLAKCMQFANDFTSNNSGNILLYGPSGLGKSFMAACIFNKISDKGYYAMYKSSYRLFQFMEDYKFGKIDRDTYSIAYNSVYDCDLLVIDDFGTEFITSYTQSVFFDLLNSRLINGKSTIVSTNLNFDKLREYNIFSL